MRETRFPKYDVSSGSNLKFPVILHVLYATDKPLCDVNEIAEANVCMR